MNKRKILITFILLLMVMGLGWAINEAPVFRYLPPQPVVYWSPPPEFGLIPAREWRPPPGYEKYAQAWSPPDWWGEPGQWSPPPELN